MTGRLEWACMALLAPLLVTPCGFYEEIASPRVRLVDRRIHADAGRAAPTGTIAHDTRPVMREFPRLPLVWGARVDVRGSGRTRHRQRLHGQLAGAARVVVTPSTSLFFEQPALKRRSRSAAHLVPVTRDGDAAWVDVPVDVEVDPGVGREQQATAFELWATLRVPPEGPYQSLRTLPVEIPAGARLEFGIGILEEAWDQGAVEFVLHACEGGKCRRIFSEVLDPGQEEARAWQERRLSLAGWSGRRVTFRFDTHHAAAGAKTFSFPQWADPTLYVEERARRDRPNLLLISLDTLRADHLPVYGYARRTAPFIESTLAAGGTLFERAISPASTTGPSHMTLFTSLQPSVHRLVGNSGVVRLAEGATTLAEALRAHGYETGAVTENAAIALGRGYERGFASYVETQHSPLAEGSMQATLEQGRAFLRRRGDRRFFLFLHTYQVHNPYEPPAAYRELFAGEPPGRERPARLPAEWHPDSYDREIRYADDLLGAFFREQEAEGLIENTVVIVTSDHGEAFSEHGYYAHGSGLHEEILHVPLLFQGPDIPAGRRVRMPVGLVDLMPTLLELAGAPPVPGMMGRSFAQVVRGAPPDEDADSRPFFSEAWREMRVTFDAEGRLRSAPFPQPSFAVRVGDRKLIRYRDAEGFRYSYYDLATDPGEQRDLYAEDPAGARDLRELIESYTPNSAELHSRLMQGSGETIPLDWWRAERLRALGYIQ